jgi:cytochrome P450
MVTENRQIPSGPSEPYDEARSLLTWMDDNRTRYGDIYRASIYGSNVFVVSNPRYIQHILRTNWQNYRKGLAIKRVELLLGRGLISSEGEFWKSQRRLIQPAFHADVIAGLMSVITQANAGLLAKWERAALNQASVNVTHDLSLMILELVLTAIFGEDHQEVAPAFSILAEESARDLQFAQTFRPLRKVVAQVVTRRRAANRSSMDLLGMLMAARDRDTGQVMQEGQLVTEIMTLIVAGHETTALTLNWIWYLLSRNPAAEARLSRELAIARGDQSPPRAGGRRVTYISHIIDEALRLYPPVWLMSRKALNDDHFDEYFIPARTEIYFSPYIVQRHPDLWEAPERFDPDRFDPNRSKDRHNLAAHPFGAGPRNCIGENLARLEMELHLIMFAKKLRLRRMDETPLEFDLGVNLRSKHDFIMAPEIKELVGS